jgi:catechol 2,3-dioxygenase-like lactoylglutathione lyase family enzyme
MLRGIDRLVLRVPGVPAAVKYYRDVLGMRVVREEHRVASLQFDSGNHGTGELVLHSDPDLPAEAVYLLVDDVRDMYRRRAELKLAFNTPPMRSARGYRAIVKDPFGTVLHLIDRSPSEREPAAASRAAVEDGKAPGSLFAGMRQKSPARPELLVRLYAALGRTADDLPYTRHFESVYEPYIAAFDDPKPDRSEVWRHLLNLRKRSKLPKLGDARSPAPAVSPEARQRLRELLGDDIGKRDRLPYTDRFERLVESFNASLPRPLSAHQVWRLVASLAK